VGYEGTGVLGYLIEGLKLAEMWLVPSDELRCGVARGWGRVAKVAPAGPFRRHQVAPYRQEHLLSSTWL
jgi:hypothetical protein